MKTFFLFFTLFFAFSWAHAQEVLVKNRPTYEVGESVNISTKTTFGKVTISVITGANVRKGKNQKIWTEFRVDVNLNGRVLFSDQAYMQKDTWNGYLMHQGVMYRSTSTVPFPLREGDVFENQVLKSSPCAEYPSRTCMKIVIFEECYGTRQVTNGIEYICNGTPGGKIRYVMDSSFKWPVEFQVLE